VLLDADLAKLYGVETKVLLQALKRNPDRFPKDFMFQLTDREYRDLRSQFVTSSWGGRRYAPYVFTNYFWGPPMNSSTLATKGQVTIPKRLRDYLGLSPGDKVRFEYTEEGAGIARFMLLAALTHAAMASCASRIASASVLPQALQPGKSGTTAI
jgi:AbrB family looped-hinge helix DNA binding protein